MYKKISLIFLLLFANDTKPLGVVELFSCICFAVGAKVLYKQLPAVLIKLGHKKMISMPIDLPTKVVGKNYSLEMTKKKMNELLKLFQARALELKKNMFGAVEKTSQYVSFVSPLQSEKKGFSEYAAAQSGTSFTQAQQNNFSAKGFFPRIYVSSGEGSESAQNARSKYRWQGAFLGSVFTAGVLKTVDSTRSEKSKN